MDVGLVWVGIGIYILISVTIAVLARGGRAGGGLVDYFLWNRSMGGFPGRPELQRHDLQRVSARRARRARLCGGRRGSWVRDGLLLGARARGVLRAAVPLGREEVRVRNAAGDARGPLREPGRGGGRGARELRVPHTVQRGAVGRHRVSVAGGRPMAVSRLRRGHSSPRRWPLRSLSWPGYVRWPGPTPCRSW